MERGYNARPMCNIRVYEKVGVCVCVRVCVRREKGEKEEEGDCIPQALRIIR